MKHIIKISVFLICFTSLAQEKNVFHDRSFWNENPSLNTVKEKITEGMDPVAFNNNGFDATTNAILAKANADVIKYLLSLEGNSVDKRTHDSRIYLHWATYAGHTEIIKTLLKKGSSTTAQDSRGNTPLTFAANSGQADTAVYDIFIENGVNLASEKNQDGANVLLLVAPFLENEKDLDYFISKGIALNSTDKNGNGIFNYAARKGNVRLLKQLVKKGVDYKSLNKNGGNAFMFAAQGTRGFSNSLPVYEYLKNLGLEPNIVTNSGSTPLHRIAYTNTDPAIFTLFLKAGVKVEQKDSDGNTPFLNAASKNDLEIVKLLSKQVKNIDHKNNKGQTALMLAYANNSVDVVELLLQKGADISLKDANGNNMAYYLLESFNTKKPTEFNTKLELLQKKEVALNTVQGEGNTLYHLAAKTNNLNLLKQLASYKLNIDVNVVNAEGMTALHQAAMKAEDDEMMKYLITLGAKKDAKTDFEETAYDLASENELLQKNNVELKFLK
ncbi:ankyrin repeat domain-containing protein [Aequorivita marina]|uniref:ankyrin repeat domain-containing protein n=1 Tax=Aequorivita marina TaxID=3073654 RepID=UPI00287658E9|nr:ankyrin repeat domain-containing protein [Aequorivita sp. S2608]MDS1296853.1 ankyrin repeat domain-containing protein [Aequorivita sp. S2608]